MSDLTPAQKYERQAKLNRERQQAYYKRHTVQILEKKADLYKKNKSPTPAPTPAPAPEAPEKMIIRVKRKTRNNKEPEPEPEPVKMTIKVNKSRQSPMTAEAIIDLLKADYTDPKNRTLITHIGNINRIVNTVKENDFVKIINSATKTMHDIENAKQPNGTDYGTSSKKGMFQMILKLIDGKIIKATDKTRIAFYDKFKIYDFKGREEGKEKTTNVNYKYPTVDEYIEKVKEKHGESSKQYILTSLHSENAIRDNYYNIILTQTKKDTNDKSKNFLFNPKKGNIQIIINSHKTEKGGVLQNTLSTALTNSLRKYIKENNIGNGDYVFKGKTPLSGYISNITKTLYPDIPKGEGGISLFRKMRVSKSFKDNDSIEDRQELARKMGHSLQMQNDVYKRN